MIYDYMRGLSKNFHGLGGGWSRVLYGSTSIRTTPPFSSLRIPVPSTDLANNSSSWATEPTEYAPMPIDTDPLECSSPVPVSSVVVVPRSAVVLPVPKAVEKYVPPPVPPAAVVDNEGKVRVLNFHVDHRWPSPSSPLPFEESMRRQEAVATTGRLATVKDMQSSTRADMITGIPPLLMMNAACTSDTIVVTTAQK